MQKLVEILKRRLAAGVPLPAERTLADELGVKRHQLRNALKILRDAGELEAAKPRADAPARKSGQIMARGTNPVEVVELRFILEPALARLAAVRATPLDISRIERAATTPPDADRGATDLAFHKAVATAAGNSLAADLYYLIRRVGADVRLHLGSTSPNCPNRIKQRDLEHQAIAAAIAARDPDRAEATMRAHLLRVREQIARRMMAGAEV